MAAVPRCRKEARAKQEKQEKKKRVAIECNYLKKQFFCEMRIHCFTMPPLIWKRRQFFVRKARGLPQQVAGVYCF